MWEDSRAHKIYIKNIKIKLSLISVISNHVDSYPTSKTYTGKGNPLAFVRVREQRKDKESGLNNETL